MRSWRGKRGDSSWEDGEAGVAYVAVLLLVLIVTLTGLGFLRLKEIQTHLTEEALREERARLAAQGCLSKVSWLLRRLPSLQKRSDPNPFSRIWYGPQGTPLRVTDFLDLLSPVFLDPLSTSSQNSYCFVGDVRNAGTKVKIRVLGSVDVNGNGIHGISDRDGDGQLDLPDADPEDTNLFMEAYLGLPGSLGKDVVVAARGILDEAGNPLTLETRLGPLRVAKGIELPRFKYNASDGERSFGTIVGGEIIVGSPRLPEGLFDPEGVPQEAYFQGVPIKRLEGPVRLTPDHDPTRDLPKGGLIWVNGDVEIRELDLERRWRLMDVGIVSTGKITAEDLHCWWKGRVVLIGREVELRGETGEWINGIIVAGKAIRLSSRDFKKVECFENLACRGKYFFGSMLSGGDLRIEGPGWVLVFDPLVLIGAMGWTFPEGVTLDSFEDGELGPWWTGEGGELRKGVYLSDETESTAGDSLDKGLNGIGEVMRFTVRPPVSSPGAERGFALSLHGCPHCPRDWRYYDYLEFTMAIDNWSTAWSSSVEVIKESKFKVVLKDENGKELSYDLLKRNDSACPWTDIYSNDQWGTGLFLYKIDGDVLDPDTTKNDYADGVLPKWKSIRVPFSCLEGDLGRIAFDRLKEISFQLYWWSFTWRRSDIEENEERTLLPGAGGAEICFDPDEKGPEQCRIVFYSSSLDEELLWRHEPSQEIFYVPCIPNDHWPGIGDKVVKKKDVSITLRLDSLKLPGAPWMNYGFPSAFALEPYLIREIGEKELGF